MFLLNVWLGGSAWAQVSTLDVQKGTLPLLIVAGHGGTLPLEGADVRDPEKVDDPHFVMFRDVETNELAWDLFCRMQEECHGQKPTLIRNLIHRKFADVNRSPELSSDDPVGVAHHQAFHKAIKDEIDRIKSLHGFVLLIDIHGQTKYSSSLMIGTARNEVVSDWSIQVLWGPEGLVPKLEQAGFTVDPPLSDGDQRYSGGYIVRQHGADPAVEAWQFEHNGELRRDPKLRSRYVDVLAKVFCKLWRSHLHQ